MSARYTLLRLPLEVAPLFSEWLGFHAPGKARRVLERVRDNRAGRLYRSDYAQRMRGSGEYARLLARRLGYAELPALECKQFSPPAGDAQQMSLF